MINSKQCKETLSAKNFIGKMNLEIIFYIEVHT